MRTTNTQENTRERLLEILEDFTTRKEHAEDVEVILEEFVVIPRTGLPEVTTDACWGDIKVASGLTYAKDVTAELMQRNALATVAIWQYVESRTGQTEAAEAKRDARRDELATELVAEAYGESEFDRKYVRLSAEMKKAVDRIIELEEASA